MKDFTKGKILPEILLFSFPIFIGDFLQQMYVIVDTIVVGKLLGTQALAAIGVTQPIYGLINSIFLGISIGFSILLAHQIGAKTSKDEYFKSIGTLVNSTILCATVIFILGFFLSKKVLFLSGTPQNLLEQSDIYLKCLLLGIVANFAMYSIGAVLRAFGDTKTPLIMSVTGSILNILLDIILVQVFNMGLLGAALGTVLSQFVTSIVTIIFSLKVYHIKLTNIKYLKNSFLSLKKALLYGMPIAVQYIFISIGTIILVKIVVPLGITVIGAFTVIGRIEGFISMAFLNLSSGLTTYTAQNHGAKFYARIKKGFTQTLLFQIILTICISITCMIFSRQISFLFSKDADIIEITQKYILITSPFLFLYSIMVLIHGMLNGLGKTRIPLICTIFSYLIIRLPVSYFAKSTFEILGLIWAVIIGWGAGLLYTCIATFITTKKDSVKTSSDDF